MRCSVTIRCEMQTRRRELVTSSVREAEKVVFHVKKVSRSTLKKLLQHLGNFIMGRGGNIITKTATLYTEFIAKKSAYHTQNTFS